MRLFSIDPGNIKSAYVILEDGIPTESKIVPNDDMIRLCWDEIAADAMCIEYMRSRGMPTANEELDTQFWAGRFVQAWQSCADPEPWYPIYRMDVKMTICGQTKARDSHIRQGIINLFGGQNAAIGGKKCKKCKGKGWFGAGRSECPVCLGKKWEHPPGPLLNISNDEWSALAIGLTCIEQLKDRKTWFPSQKKSNRIS